MANRTLLNEAIAEAESIRDAALANAKAALEESFAPHIKEMFSKKVQEMESDEDEKIEEMKEKGDKKEELEEMDAASFRRKNSPSHNMDGEGGPVNPQPHKAGKSTIQEEEEEVELDALLSQLDEEMDSEDKEMKEGYDKEDDKKVDEAEDHDDDKKMDEMEATEDEKHLKEEEGEEEAGEEMEMDMDDPEIDLEEMTEEQLMDLIRDVIDELEEKGEIEADGGEEADAEVEIEDEEEMMEGENKEDLDEVGKWNIKKKGISDDVEEGVGKWKIKKESEDLDESKHEDDDKAMEEALAEINKLKADLQEVNLLNAKLLYANKIFRSKNLCESKKVKVLESFDKAATVKEAKLIFETLNEGVESRERRRPARGVKGSASKTTNVIKENKQPIVESNDMVARFQKLAGIK